MHIPQLTGEYVGAFGDTTEDGYLRKVESIAMDPLLGRMLVADESEGVIKVYDLEGQFTGQLVGDGVFYRQPEGVALLECAEGRGYYLATDQDYVKNRFLIFDRENLAIRGTFSGAVTINTDGVALTGHSFGPFTRGAFYAVHDDGNVAAFDLAEIIAAFGLAAALDNGYFPPLSFVESVSGERNTDNNMADHTSSASNSHIGH